MKRIISSIIAISILLSTALLASCNSNIPNSESSKTENKPNNTPHSDNTPAEKYTENLKYKLLEDGTYEVSIGGATNDESIVIPPKYSDTPITRIAEDGFKNATKLKSIKLPDSITSIGFAAFAYCDSLESINIPNGVTVLEQSTFYGCKSLVAITIPESITNIKKLAFYGCGIKTIELPDGLTNIDSKVFYKCESLEWIVIPSNVSIIGDEVFRGCVNLRYAVFPVSLTKIGLYVFESCDKFETVKYVGSTEQYDKIKWTDKHKLPVTFNFIVE